MFCHHSINAGVSCHLAYQDLLVIHQVLSHTLVCPVVDELLEGHVSRPVIWIGHQDGLLDMIGEVAAFLDFLRSDSGKLWSVAVATKS